MNEICDTYYVDKEAVAEVKSKMAKDSTMYKLSEKFKLLSSPVRLKILNALMHHDLCVCDLGIVLDMSQSAVSHQLRILRHTKFVNYSKEGRRVYYSLIKSDLFKKILPVLQEFRDNQETEVELPNTIR